MLKKTFAILIFLGCVHSVCAQDNRPLPFLDINPDVRAAGMGNSTMGEAKGMYLYSNPTSILQGDVKRKIYASYSYGLMPEINNERESYHATSVGVRLFNRHALMVGFRYFGGLSVPSIDSNGNPKAAIEPNDWSIDMAYTFKFNNHLAAYLGGSFIQSTLDETSYLAGANGGVYYSNDFGFNADNAVYTVGLGFNNLGAATMTDKGNDFTMPGSLGLGGSVGLPLCKNHRINAALSTRYFIIPSSAAAFTANLGLEYELFNIAALRTGYYMDTNASENSYFSVGLGFKYKFVSVEAAYCFKNNKDFNNMQLGISFQL